MNDKPFITEASEYQGRGQIRAGRGKLLRGVSIRVPEEIKIAIDRAAARNRRSFNAEVVMAMESHALTEGTLKQRLIEDY